MLKSERGCLQCAPCAQEMVETYAAPERMEKIAKLGPVAEKLGCSLSQLAIAWCLANPHVSSVLTGASQVAQVLPSLLTI